MLFRSPPGSTVLVNALFPTAWHHLHGRGARLLRVDRAGELDLDRILAGLDEPGVAALWLELAPNASAGRPLPVELLEEVAAAARKRGVPLVLDACRLFTNAVALADAHASQMAAALCACGDACTAGLAKEVAAPLGGIVATRSAPLAERVRYVARRMYGHGLGPSARGRLLRALGDDPVVAVRTRADFTRRLHDTLLRLQVPVVGPPGGHAVWVEPTGLGYVATATRTAADALAEDLYLRAGIRAARNLGPPGEADLLRLAVRTDICTEDAFELVTSAFAGLKGR